MRRREAIVRANELATHHHDAKGARELIAVFGGNAPVAAIEVQLHDSPDTSGERTGRTYVLTTRAREETSE